MAEVGVHRFAAGDDQLAAKHAAALRAVETPVLP